MTINSQLASAVSGDVVEIASGVYAESINNTIPSGVTLKAAPGATVIITPTGEERGLYIEARNDITFDGLTIDSTDASLDAVKVTSGAQRITIKNCTIKNAERQGILLTGETTGDIVIENCVIRDIDPGGVTGLIHGIYNQAGGDVQIRDCEIGPCPAFGIHAFGGADTGTYTIERNFIHDCHTGIGAMYGHGIVRNNVVRDGEFCAYFARYNMVEVVVEFNTAYNCPVGICSGSFSHADASVVYRNNVLSATVYGIDHQATGAVVGTIVSDHNLLDAPTPDRWNGVAHTGTDTAAAFAPITDDGLAGIKPTIGNPAPRAGVAVAGVATDYGGNARATPPTIGAWEWLVAAIGKSKKCRSH